MNKRHKSFDYIVSSYFSTNDRTSTCTGLEQANLNTNHIGGQTKSFQEQGDRRLLYYLLSFRSMVWWLEILPRRHRSETSYERSPNTASPERMSSMVTPVEVSVASTSRCRRWRLPERRRVLSRPIATPAFVLLASRGQKPTCRAQSHPLGSI